MSNNHSSFVRLARRLVLVSSLLALPACPATPEHQEAVDIDLQRFRVDVGPDDYAIGGDQPLVTIVVWSDYACAPCGRTWQVMKNLVEDYGDDLRVVFRAGTVPGFQHGERAAEAALAAGAQGKFWEMHWRLFEHPEDFSRPVLRKHAEVIGLDVQQFLDDFDTGRYSSQRIRDRRQAIGLGLGPLPAAFVNGLFVLGFKDEETWHALVDRELASARKLIQDGTPRADVYAEFMRTAVIGAVTEDSDEAKRLREQRKAEQDAEKPELINKPDPKQRYAVPSGAAGFGPIDAPVVVVEFVDYQCPYCRKAHEQVVPALLAKYPDDVRVEIRHLPLEIHAAAAGAARAAITAARQDALPAFHAKLFELAAKGQGELGFSTFVREAGVLGLDVERFKTDFQTREVSDVLLADVLLARRLGVTGTPGFFVNGRYLQGARTPATFESLIDEDLVRARELAAAGTPRAELHEALMREAIGPAGFPNAGLELAPTRAPSPD
ncbi:DsbA family protein [Nannocystaceae bacterium ST9]